MLNHINTDAISCLNSEKSENSVAVTLVSCDEFENWSDSLSDKQQSWVRVNNFSAKSGEILIYSAESGVIENIIAGTGTEQYDPWIFAKIASALPDGEYHIDTAMNNEDADIAAFGWAMAHYKFDQYLAEKNKKSAILTVAENCDLARVSRWARGSTLARDLVNTPTCDMGPTELAFVGKKLAEAFGATINITVGDDLLKNNFNTIHAVGRAAEKEPRLIDIKWGDEKAPKVTLVGKGVCFDTGGLDIKPSGAMLIMKKDMGGAAHVLGLAQMIMESDLDIRLRVLIPAVENNISANAFRPGDIIKSYEGTTIEIGNTDAEGRLVLCDALALASEEQPDVLMDFATLTGAARVAMGTDVPPYFTDDEELSTQLLKHSEQQHDPLWPLPLYTPYKALLNSTIADINNVASTGLGGAITAALFLKHFVPKNISWVHLDVYAWNTRHRAGRPKGGEAMGLRAVYEYLMSKYGTQ